MFLYEFYKCYEIYFVYAIEEICVLFFQKKKLIYSPKDFINFSRCS